MAALANHKHEVFAQEVAKGKPGAEAYLASGYTAKDDNNARASASRLLANDNVRDRVLELQQQGALRTQTTVETLLAACWDLIKDARADKQHNAASATIERAAKIAGLWVDRAENKDTTDVRKWLQQH